MSDFSMVGRVDLEQNEVVNISFLSDTNSLFAVFFDDLSFIVFQITESSTSSARMITRVHHQPPPLNEMHAGNRIPGAQTDLISKDQTMMTFGHCTACTEQRICLSVHRVQLQADSYLVQRHFSLPGVDYSYGQFSNDACLVIKKQERGHTGATEVIFWPVQGVRNDEPPFSYLQGTDGRFTCEGRFVVTWDGCGSEKASSERQIYIYHTQSVNRRLTSSWRHSAHRNVVAPTLKRVSGIRGCVILHAELLHAEIVHPQRFDNSLGTPTLSPEARLLLLCDVSWSETAKIFLLDMNDSTSEFTIDMPGSLREGMHSPCSLARKFFEQSPFIISPNKKLFFLVDRNQRRGTVYSAKTGIPVFVVDWKDEDFDPVRFEFDPSGHYISLHDRVKVKVFRLSSNSSSTRDWQHAPFCHDEHVVLEFLREYDVVFFKRLVTEGFSFDFSVWSEAFLLKKDGIFDQIDRHRGEQDVMHVVTSTSNNLVAFVIRGPPRIELWKIEESGDHHSRRLEPWKSIRLPDETTEDSAGSSLGMLYATENGRIEFVLLNPQANGVKVVQVDVGASVIVDASVISSPLESPLEKMKLTADGAKALILFQNGDFVVLDLTTIPQAKLRGTFSYPCDINHFSESYIDRGLLHITEDNRKLIVGWNSSVDKPIAFSLQTSERRMFEEYEQNSVNLNDSAFARVLWINHDLSRSIVHKQVNRVNKLEFYSRPSIIKNLSLAFRDGVLRWCLWRWSLDAQQLF